MLICKTQIILKLKLNIINIPKQMNSHFHNQIFTVVKFQPSNVILQHCITRKLYRYEQLQRTSQQSDHPLIIKAEPLCSGFTYEKQLTTLAKQLKPKITCENKDHFDQTELNNTFDPILNFLKSGQHHGAISFENILIDNEGNMRLKDPKITKQSNFMQNDFQRLGFIMLQCALLKNEEQLSTVQLSKSNLANVLFRFSAKFIANIWILLQNKQSLIKKIEFTSQIPCDEQYKSVVQQLQSYVKKLSQRKLRNELIKASEQKKIIVIPPLNLNLKFNKAKKAENKKINLSGKRQSRNENENQEQIQNNASNYQEMEKNNNRKIFNKNNEIKLKFKKLQLIDNFRSPLKRKGKTVDKKTK